MSLKTIPYGLANYYDVREKNRYYVDKTMFIPHLERAGEYLFFIRPRRFGKSLLLSTLEHYYDMAMAEHFDMLFKDTYIYDNPTPEKNAHLILTFNFSLVSSKLTLVERSFDEHVKGILEHFGRQYCHIIGDDYLSILDNVTTSTQRLEYALQYIGSQGYRAYIFIDEYDNFTNTILSTQGQHAYEEITHGVGFYRSFFSVLKGAAGKKQSGLARLFITGVSPVTMDDVTSGFNIGTHISLEPEFNEVLGFTEQEVRDMLHYYAMPMDDVLPLMQAWYNNYRFSLDADTYLFNTDMVLYFVKHYLKRAKPPRDLVDQNVKVDYGKLRHLMLINKQLNGNFNLLQHIIETRQVKGNQIKTSFPMEHVTQQDNFFSLLYYFGLLTLSKDNHHLMVPNETVMQLFYSYIREGLIDVGAVRANVQHLIGLLDDMLYKGIWQPVFTFLTQELDEHTSIRDYLHGEKVVQTFLLVYLNVSTYFIARSEREMHKGYVDIFIEPYQVLEGEPCYGYIAEVKYLPREERSEAVVQKQVADAREQLQRYYPLEAIQSDTPPHIPRLPALRGRVQMKRVVLVYAGWELLAMDEV